MKKMKFFDAVGITIFGTLLVLGGSFINLDVFDAFNPIAKMFENFELTDIGYQMRDNKDYDPNVVLVNIGELDRAGIAKQIEILNKHNPKAIGIDAFFRNPKHSEDMYKDSLLVAGDSSLAAALSKVKNMVLGMELIEDTGSSKIAEIKYSHPMFMHPNVKLGYLDMISEGKNTFKTARNCFLTQNSGDSVLMSFPMQLAYLFNPESLERVKARNKETEVINYFGNIQTVTSDGIQNSKIVFAALDVEDVLMAENDPERDAALGEVVKDKIIIMGFMGPNFDTYDKEDRFFTPINKNYVGRADEDMYGVVVHANICSMILRNDFIDDLPKWADHAINLGVTFLNILLFMYLYFKLELFWDGATLLITLIESVLLTSLLIIVFNEYNLVLNFGLSILALFLMPNIIELYYGLVKTSELKIRNKFSSLKVKKSGINLNK